jgi:hypothetical protein
MLMVRIARSFDPEVHPHAPGAPGAFRPARPRVQSATGQPSRYVDAQVIASLEATSGTQFDHAKLLRLISELNDSYSRGMRTPRMLCSARFWIASRRCVAALASPP